MPYGLIFLVILVTLTGRYLFFTEVSPWLKAMFVGLLLVSFVWDYGIFLQLGLCLCLSVYFTYLKARRSN
jgi:membrane protein implicated in regulation of membrane protease activity